MGLYIGLNRRRLRNWRFNTYLQEFTLNFIEFLQQENKIQGQKYRIEVFDPKNRTDYLSKLGKWSTFDSTFKELFNTFSEKNACLQIVSMLELMSPSDGKPILVNFEIFLNAMGEFYEDFGHWSFDVSGESEEFPKADSTWDFNDLFIINPNDEMTREEIELREHNIEKNLHFLNKIIKWILRWNQPKKYIERMQIGDESIPWNNIHYAFYVYRNKEELFQHDLFKSFDKIRKEIEDPSYYFTEKEKERLREKWKENLFSKIKEKKLLDKITWLNKQNRFIIEYFGKEAIVEEGSFILYREKGYAPLYPVLEKFYTSLTATLDEAISWEQIWDSFRTTWEKKFPTVKEKKME